MYCYLSAARGYKQWRLTGIIRASTPAKGFQIVSKPQELHNLPVARPNPNAGADLVQCCGGFVDVDINIGTQFLQRNGKREPADTSAARCGKVKPK